MRRGFVLLAVLWLLVLVTGAVALAHAGLRTELDAARNRILLTRARWAAEACAAIATERWLNDSTVTADSAELGRDTQCEWRIDDPARRLAINGADRATLERFLGAYGLPDSAAIALADRIVRRARTAPLTDTSELRAFGVPPAALGSLTMDASDGIAISAEPAVLRAAGLSREAVEAVLERRRAGLGVSSLAQLADLTATADIGDIPELAARLRFAPSYVVLTSNGWVRGRISPRASVELLVRRSGARLAVLRRRVW